MADRSNIPEKDCRTCNKRRIKCDRAIPDCKKCTKRGLTCPGYGDRLKWGQGVASRGRWKGQLSPDYGARRPTTVAIQQPQAARHQSVNSRSEHADKARHPGANLTGDISVALPSSNAQDDECSSSVSGDEESVDSIIFTPCVPARSCEAEPLVAPLNLAAGIHLTPACTIVQDPVERKLLLYYDVHVIPQLNWLDTPKNPWRTLLPPLAAECPSLLCAMLAMSAGQILMRRDQARITGFKESTLRHYRDKTLSLLADNFKIDREFVTTRILTGLKKDKKQSFSEIQAVLAAVMLLFHLELQQTGLSACKIHLQAATAILRRWGKEFSRSISPIADPDSGWRGNRDETSEFVLQEYLSVKSWAVFSDFESPIEEEKFAVDWSVLPPGRRGVFGEFLCLIQSITQLGRHECEIRTTQSCLAWPTISSIRLQLDFAYDAALLLGQTLTLRSPTAIQDLHHVAGMYYHAVLILAHDVLHGRRGWRWNNPLQTGVSESDVKATVSASREKIIQHLRDLQDLSACSQNLFWPLFIAGLNCRGLLHEQKLIQRRIKEIVGISGCEDRLTCLGFLNKYWSDSELSWIEMAGEWTKHQQPFLVL